MSSGEQTTQAPEQETFEFGEFTFVVSQALHFDGVDIDMLDEEGDEIHGFNGPIAECLAQSLRGNKNAARHLITLYRTAFESGKISGRVEVQHSVTRALGL